jgi:hypothetical protein
MCVCSTGCGLNHNRPELRHSSAGSISEPTRVEHLWSGVGTSAGHVHVGHVFPFCQHLGNDVIQAS